MSHPSEKEVEGGGVCVTPVICRKAGFAALRITSIPAGTQEMAGDPKNCPALKAPRETHPLITLTCLEI